MTFPLVGIDMGGAACATVYQDRLVLAGTATISDLLMVSKTGVWDDMRIGIDNEQGVPVPEEGGVSGFWLQQVSSRTNTFSRMVQQDGLLIFGDLGEAVIPQDIFNAERTAIRENSWYGSDVGRTPLIVSGNVVFIQSGGRDLRIFNFNEVEGKYLAPSLLDRSGQVFTRALDMTYTPSHRRKADTVYVVDDEGRVPVMVMKLSEPTHAWGIWETGPDTHRVLAAAAPLGRLVFLVERNGTVSLETLASDDAGQVLDGIVVRQTGEDEDEGFGTPVPPATWGNVDATDIGAPRVLIRSMDGTIRLYDDPVTVASGAFVGMPAFEDVQPGDVLEIGWPYDRIVETLPFVANTQSGTRRSVTKSRILDVAVDFAEGATPAEVAIGVGGRVKQSPVRTAMRDTSTINRRRFGGRAGWKDRVAVRMVFSEPVEIAGMATKAVG